MALVFIDYIFWHFTVAPGNILSILGNYLKSTHQRFLITTHLRTLFSPWHRLDPSKIGHEHRPSIPERFLDLIVDFYIRILGAIVRLSVVIVGLVWEVVLCAAFILLLVGWLVWPALSVFLLYRGLTLLF